MFAFRSRIFPYVRGAKFFSSNPDKLSDLLTKLNLHATNKNKPSRVKDILNEVLQKSEQNLKTEIKPNEVQPSKKMAKKSETVTDRPAKEVPAVVAEDIPVKDMLQKSIASKNDPSTEKLSSFLAALEKHTTTVDKPQPSISEIFSGIKIEKSEMRQRLKPRLYKLDKSFTSDLLEGQGLSIFNEETIAKVSNKEKKNMSLYEQLESQELEKSLKTLPKNFFEEAIDLTKEGKLWNFPINNEQGIIEEAKVPFHKHIFFESYLTLFPSNGPARHFMELVLVGLSKNPYLTVEEKENHILWFADYFKENADMF